MGNWASRVTEWLGEHVLAVLLGLLIPVAGVLAFVELAERVMGGHTREFDERLIFALRQPHHPATPLGPPWMAEAGRDLTSLGGSSVIVLVTVVVAGFLLLDRKYAATLFVVTATGSGFALSAALKAVFQRPRPEVVPHLMKAYYSSFPSGHSMVSAVVYLTLGALMTRLVAERRLKFYVMAVAVFVTTVVGVSRVYMGVHYPTDVLAGWCAGLSWASLCWLAARALQRRGAIEGEGLTDLPRGVRDGSGRGPAG